MDDKTDDISDGKEFTSTITRAIALVIGMGLFITDKYMHMIDPPLDMIVYGFFATVALGNDQAMALLGANKKH